MRLAFVALGCPVCLAGEHARIAGHRESVMAVVPEDVAGGLVNTFTVGAPQLAGRSRASMGSDSHELPSPDAAARFSWEDDVL